MVEFNLIVNQKQRTAYFNQKIVETLGYNLSLQLGTSAGVIYSKDAPKEDIIRSTEIILKSLKHQAELEERRTK